MFIDCKTLTTTNQLFHLIFCLFFCCFVDISAPTSALETGASQVDEKSQQQESILNRDDTMVPPAGNGKQLLAPIQSKGTVVFLFFVVFSCS